MYWSQNAQALSNQQQLELLQILEQTTPTQNATLSQTTAGDFTLLYRDVYLHNPQGAVSEASLITQKHCKPAIGRAHLILGIGLGYLVEAVYQHSPGQLIVYEPDLNLLKFVLENVDLSEYLNSGRMTITNNISQMLAALREYTASEDPLDILVIPGYAQLLHAEIPPLMDAIFQMVEERIRDFKTGQHFHQQWTRQFFQNLPYFPQTAPFSAIQEVYSGKPALIIGRGPSLDQALEDIAILKDSMTLIAAGSALHRLHQANITPDMAVFYDANGIREQLHGLPEAYLREIIFIISPFTETLCFQAPSKAKVLCYPENGEDFAQWLQNTQISNPAFTAPLLLEGGGTVSLLAMQLAQRLQSKSVILIGQDLAFPNNQAYAGGIAVKQDTQGRLALERQANLFSAPEAMTTVQGQDGQPLAALKAYASFIRHFERMAEENQKQPEPISLYNASIGGAAIQGYLLKPLAEFRNQFAPFQHPRNWSEITAFSNDAYETQAEDLRHAISRLKQDLYQALALHEALSSQAESSAQEAKQALYNLLNQNGLISHFLLFEMLHVQQNYHPNPQNETQITANQALLQQNILNCIEILKNQILPQVIASESQLINTFHNPIQSKTLI